MLTKEELKKKIGTANQYQLMYLIVGIIIVVIGRTPAIDAEHARSEALSRLIFIVVGFISFCGLQVRKAVWNKQMKGLDEPATARPTPRIPPAL